MRKKNRFIHSFLSEKIGDIKWNLLMVFEQSKFRVFFYYKS